MSLNTNTLEKALKTLEKSVERHDLEPADDMIRDSVVKRFEYTYSEAVVLMKRYLENDEPPLNVDEMTFKQVLRAATERGLLSGDIAKWEVYREKRNKTSHAYKAENALDIISVMPDFINEIKYLIEVLNERFKDD
jgi:nucleotidyltransferase substrate binding protein (TIGR01987 family)